MSSFKLFNNDCNQFCDRQASKVIFSNLCSLSQLLSSLHCGLDRLKSELDSHWERVTKCVPRVIN